jgi:hypothetical protein
MEDRLTAKPVKPVTRPGTPIDCRAEHCENVRSPKLDSWLSASNVTFERAEQPLKQALEMVSSDDGTQIDFSAEQS